MADWHRPGWLTCLGEIVDQYQDDIDEKDDAELRDESYRMEVTSPPTNPAFNDRDWRTYRRLVRQEMHRRGLA